MTSAIMTHKAGTPRKGVKARTLQEKTDNVQPQEQVFAYENASYIFLMLAIALAPMFVGGNREWSWSVLLMLSCASLFFWALGYLKDGNMMRIPAGKIWYIRLPFLGLILWIFVQHIPMPEAYSHLAHPLWDMARETIGADAISASISLTPDKTASYGVRLLGYGVMFWIALQIGRKRAHAMQIYFMIALISTIYAAFGLLSQQFPHIWENLTANMQMGSGIKQDIGGISSTFLHPDTYGLYASLGILITVALLVQTVLRGTSALYKDLYLQEVRKNVFSMQSYLIFVLLGIQIAALIASMSMTGWMNILVAGLAFFFMLGFSRGGRRSRWLFILTFLILSPLMLWMITFKGSNLVDQTTHIEHTSLSRQTLYESVAQISEDFSLIGSGYGSFESVFRIYRDSRVGPDITQQLDHAYNSYLENMLELGLPAALLFVFVIFAMAMLCLKGAILRRRNYIFPAAGFCATLMIAMHSMVDFSAEIPAITMTYIVVMGVACACSWSRDLEEDDRAHERKRKRIPRYVTFAASSALILLISISSVKHIAAFAVLHGTQDVKRALYQGKDIPKNDLMAMIEANKTAMGFVDRPEYYSDTAVALYALAHKEGIYSPDGMRTMTEAKALLQRALLKYPANPYGWAQLAYLTLISDGNVKRTEQYLMMSFNTGPYERGLLTQRLSIAALLWEDASDDLRMMISRQMRYYLPHEQGTILRIFNNPHIRSQLGIVE